MRLLIVEDDIEAAGYLVKAFSEAGHQADHAADGRFDPHWRIA
jgi:two-component system OmpR family response regulator